jgi:hypothetical protein
LDELERADQARLQRARADPRPGRAVPPGS